MTEGRDVPLRITVKGDFEGLPVRLRRAREARGYSRPRLALQLGIRADNIKKWEMTGVGQTYRPSYQNLLQLCEVLGVTPDYLLLADPPERSE